MCKKIRIGVFLAVCMVVTACGRTSGGEVYFLDTSIESGESVPEVLSEAVEEERRESAGQLSTVTVFVCGEVMVPGVYTLPAESRICDALEAACGLTEEACPDYWNLAKQLTDGEMIYFPTRAEAELRREAAGEAEDSSRLEEKDGRVNINTATLERLMTLPGIGQTRGEAILAYRRRNGAFAAKEDIMEVSGIGSATYESMRDLITVD